jgi:diacylglycerol kinase family enzyme
VDIYEPQSLEELEDVAGRLFRRAHPAVLVIGGDGTTMSTLTAMDRARQDRPWPTITLAHAGTVGTVARGLGFRRGLVPTVERFCDGATDAPFEQCTLRATDGDSHRVGFIFATGFVARFFEHYDETGRGIAAAARLTARLFLGAFVGSPLARSVLTPMPCRVTANGRPLPPEAWGVVVSSVLKDVGLNVQVTYRGGESHARPHLVATPLGPRGLGANFPRVLAGRRIVGAGTFDDLVSHFSVEWERSGPWVFDGDTHHSRRVDVSAGPVVPMATVR